MTNRIWSSHIGTAAIGSGLLAAAIYLVMITVTLAHLKAVSGHLPFDMRPLGYSLNEAKALLQALGEEGRAYYLSRQIPLDTLYPGLLALTLMASISWIGRRLPSNRMVGLGIALSLGAALFDYAENLCIIFMIWNWADLSELLIQTASTVSIAKSVLTTLAVLVVTGTGFISAFQRKTRRRA